MQAGKALAVELGDLPPEAAELDFVGTELFGAVAAAQIAVCRRGETLGMTVEGHFPADQQSDGKSQQAPGIGFLYEKQGREHHGVVPVVDAAGAATAVLEEPGLERTEKENADHVTDGIERTEQQHDSVVEHTHHVQCAENHVEGNPGKRDQERGIVVFNPDVGLTGLDEIPTELFLAAGAFQPGREETQHHLQYENGPDRHEEDRPALDPLFDIGTALDAVDDVERRQHDENG